MDDFKFPRVGVAVIIKDKWGKILIGRRVSYHGYNTWSIPGGHLEKFETPEECVKRETEEETGIIIKTLKKGEFINNFFPETNKHYITLYYIAKKREGKPTVKDPDKIAEWRFCRKRDLPKNLFSPFNNYINRKKRKSPIKFILDFLEIDY
jgi:8-oxo-dGTP diphosphatase